MIRVSRREANMIAAGQKTAQVRAQPWPRRVRPSVSLPVSYFARPADEDDHRWIERCRVVVNSLLSVPLADLDRPEWLRPLGFRNRDDLLGHFHENISPSRVVHVVTFRLGEDHPRFLTATSRMKPGSVGDYVTSPGRAVDPEEAVDQATVDRFAKAAERSNEHLRDRRRQEAAAEARHLADLLARAKANGVDVRSELRVLEERLQRKMRRTA
jgi:hypothetical protein